MRQTELVRDYKSIKQDYAFNPDIMCVDDDRVAKVKFIIDNKLSKADKVLILLYADCQSYRKLGKRLGLSHATCGKEIKRIKQLILREYNK